MNTNYLYGLTVQGIQSYIFSTNKLQEIIGASELVEKVCTSEFNKFCDDNNINGTSYLQAAGNIRYKTTEEYAKTILLEFGFLVNEIAPGLPFSQAIVEIENENIEEARLSLENKLRAERNRSFNHVTLGTMVRSKHRRTGEFATNSVTKYDDAFLDAVTYAKYSRSLEDESKNLLLKKIDDNLKEDCSFPKEFSAISKGGQHSWLALVHIDGNGMGTYIQNILKDENVTDKFNELKEFSGKVETTTKKAFNSAVQEVFVATVKAKENRIDKKVKIILPFRPLILGGDDVTVIMRADYALEFTKVYLKYFEQLTEAANITLTACAGIAYVKEKFPFHYSANLVEELCKYAKDQSDRNHSCIQIHQVKDSIFEDYTEALERELLDDFKVGPFYLKENVVVKDKIGNEIDTTSIDHIISMSKILSNEDSPKNSYREWINAKFNHTVMANELLDRIKKKSKGYSEFHTEDELKNALVYQTLLEVQNYEDKK